MVSTVYKNNDSQSENRLSLFFAPKELFYSKINLISSFNITSFHEKYNLGNCETLFSA